jgi:hypothetical protein
MTRACQKGLIQHTNAAYLLFAETPLVAHLLLSFVILCLNESATIIMSLPIRSRI